MAVTYTFATATSSIPLSQLDANFATAITLGNTAVYLGNTTTSIGNLTLTNVTISSGSINAAVTHSYNNANAVVYTNSSNVGTTSTALSFDGTNFSTTGTATASKLIPTGSSVTGNGLYLPAANALGLSTNGTNALYIDASQNVGIGTTSPLAKLSVAGDLYFQKGSSPILATGDNQILRIGVNQTEYMRIDLNGNVGIGAGSSGSKFEISAGTTAAFRATNNNGSACFLKLTQTGQENWNIGMPASSQSFVFSSDTTANIMTLLTTGNVGIGTTSTSYKLEVANTTAAGYVSSSITNLSSTGYVRQLFNIGSTFGSNGQADISYAPGIFFAMGPSTNDTTTPIVFRNNNATERMRIDSSGNVGIGVSSIASSNNRLQVNGQTSDTDGTGLDQGQLLITDVDQSTSSGLLLGYRYNTGVAEYARIQARNSAGATNIAMQVGGGNVGIGTNSPSYPLDLVGPTNGTYTRLGSTGRGLVFSQFQTSSVDNAGHLINASSIVGVMAFATAGTERMRIDSTGNVGIGTTSPLALLNVNKTTTGSANAIVISRSATNNNDSQSISWQASDLPLNYASIGAIATNTTGTLTFSTASASTNTERMRIDSSGNTYIETGNLWQYAPAPTSISSVTTLTAAQLQTDIINTTGTSYTVTVPTGTAIDTAFSAVPTTNIGFDFHIVNTASGTITMAVNTGVTSVGTLTVATGVSAHFRLRRTAANTYIMYRLS